MLFVFLRFIFLINKKGGRAEGEGQRKAGEY